MIYLKIFKIFFDFIFGKLSDIKKEKEVLSPSKVTQISDSIDSSAATDQITTTEPVADNSQDNSSSAVDDSSSPVIPPLCVIIDAGHGPKTTDRQSPEFTIDGKKVIYYEYDFNRRVAEHLIKLLKKEKIPFHISTPDFDYSTGLYTNNPSIGNIPLSRAASANAFMTANRSKYKRFLFLSIHSNAGPVLNSLKNWSLASGIETWHYQLDENRNHLGKEYAKIVQSQLMTDFPSFKNRGIKSKAEHQFTVIAETKMPAVLVELGFHNNQEEVKILYQQKTRQAFANSLFKAIKKIRNLN